MKSMRKNGTLLFLCLSFILWIALPVFSQEMDGKNSGTCGQEVTWKLDNGTLTISGSGPMYDYDGDTSYNSPFGFRSDIVHVQIEEGVTKIGKRAFYRCTGIEDVTIPSTVKALDFFCFMGCNKLSEVILPEGVEWMGDSPFYGCSSLKKASLPASLTLMGDAPFPECFALKEIEVSEQNQAYASLNGALYNKSLTRLIQYPGGADCFEVSSSLTSIGLMAVSSVSLKEATLPSKVTQIEAFAFAGSASLASLTLPEGLTSIGNNAFEGCTSLKEVRIPGSVTTIGEMAFGYYHQEEEPQIQKVSGFKIYGYKGTAAEAYASQNEFDFIDVSPTSTPVPTPIPTSTPMPTPTLTITPVPIGEKFEENGAIYLTTGKDTVSYVKPVKAAKTVKIPDKIKLFHQTFKVTGISNGAFQGNKVVKKLTIGKNVTTIGSKAFQKATALKQMVIGSSKLKKIGKNAFKGTSKSLVVKVPSAMVKSYTKLLKNAGFSGKVKAK